MRMGAVALLTAVGVLTASAGPTFARVGSAHQKRERLIVRAPVASPTPYWDSYIVPRYRYRPEDDRVSRCGPPVVPVIRYGPQESTLPGWEGSFRSGVIVCH